MLQDTLTTLHEFLLAWLTNEDGFRDDNPDLKEAMEQHGFDDVGPDELQDALPLVAEEMPLNYQQGVYDYLNATSNVDSGSTFTVNQGGAQAGNDIGAAIATDADPLETQPGEAPLDAAVRHIYNIQNNYSYIDDSGDVTNTVTAGGNVDFDANSATGDGAFAGDDAAGVVMGDNSGINAGDDVSTVDVSGDGNAVGEGDIAGDGNIVGNDVQDSNLLTGDVGGAFVGGDADDVNVGNTQYELDDIDNSTLSFGEGDATSTVVSDSYNTDNSVDNTDYSVDNSDHSVDNSDYTVDNSDHSVTDQSYDSVEIDQSSTVDYAVDHGSTGGDIDVDQDVDDVSIEDHETDVPVS